MIKLSIKKVRKIKRITQEELSLRTNLSQSYISDLENNSAPNPTLQAINSIAKALNVCPLDLIECDCEKHN